VSRPRIGLATAAEVAELDEEGHQLVAALDRAGVDGVPLVWEDEAAQAEVDDLAAVVVRSTWDYTGRPGEFHAWARRTAERTLLLNGPDLLAWSGDKRYLLELERAGVPVVPTVVLAPGDDGEHAMLDVEHVVKPVVSAGSRDTLRVGPGESRRSLDHVRRLLDAGREVLVQPYLDAVDTDGETALVHLDGVFSHALRKGALLAPGHDLVDGLFAQEEMAPREPSPAEREVAVRALAAVPGAAVPLYARVDLLPGPDGPLVLEVELVEPSLFLDLVPGAADRFAAAIVGRLRT